MPIDRRQLVLGGILLAASGAAAVARPGRRAATIDPAALEADIPRRIGAYRYATASGVLLPPRDELSLATYDRYVARVYVADGQPPVMLLIAYGSEQDYALQIHRPESCYPASGYSIGGSTAVALRGPDGRGIAGTALDAWRPGRRERILYWTRIGAAFPETVWAQRLVILRAALGGRVLDGVLVRVSTPVDGPGVTELLAAFGERLMAGLGPVAARALLGSA